MPFDLINFFPCLVTEGVQGAIGKPLVFLAEAYQTTKNPLAFCKWIIWNPAATYSPGPFPAKYHRH